MDSPKKEKEVNNKTLSRGKPQIPWFNPNMINQLPEDIPVPAIKLNKVLIPL